VLPADCWIPQVVWQQVPHPQASHSESPPGKCATPVARYFEDTNASTSCYLVDKEMIQYYAQNDTLGDNLLTRFLVVCC